MKKFLQKLSFYSATLFKFALGGAFYLAIFYFWGWAILFFLLLYVPFFIILVNFLRFLRWRFLSAIGWLVGGFAMSFLFVYTSQLPLEAILIRDAICLGTMLAFYLAVRHSIYVYALLFGNEVFDIQYWQKRKHWYNSNWTLLFRILSWRKKHKAVRGLVNMVLDGVSENEPHSWKFQKSVLKGWAYYNERHPNLNQVDLAGSLWKVQFWVRVLLHRPFMRSWLSWSLTTPSQQALLHIFFDKANEALSYFVQHPYQVELSDAKLSHQIEEIEPVFLSCTTFGESLRTKIDYCYSMLLVTTGIIVNIE